MRTAITRSVLLAVTLAAGGVAHAAEKCAAGVMADLPVTMEGRRASVPVTINGKATSFWLDSGAFFSIMSKAKAIELGLESKPVPAFGFYITGVGGKQSVDYTTIKSFELVKSALKNVDFIVGATDVGNGLIGANIIGMADTEFDLAHGSVKLINTKGCAGKAMTYWATPGQAIFTVPLEPMPTRMAHDNSFRLPVSVNDARISAELDTGAPTTLISSRAAARAGIDLNAPGVEPISGMGGFGRHFVKGWTVPVAKVSIGEESILRTHLMVIDGPITEGVDAPDMLLGADFVLAHRIFVARSQHKIYFTYSGGPPFLAVPPSRHDKDEAATPPLTLPPGSKLVEAAADANAEPTTADAFARRAAMRFGRHDGAGAIADFTRAIDLSPDTAAYYRDRARAYGESGRPVLARADVDKALALDPRDSDLLLIRARIRLHAKDRAGARADAEAAAALIPSTSLDMASASGLLTELGAPDRAIALLTPVIASHPTDARLGMLLNARCWARALSGTGLDLAVQDCSAAIKRDGPKPAYLDSRGMAWFRKGEIPRALADFDAALKAEPRIANSLYMRGLIHARMGDAAAGKTDLDAARAIRPDIDEKIASYGIKQ